MVRLFAAFWLAVADTSPRAEAPPLAIEVHARALAPGEPLRIDVLAPESLETLEGEFLGEPIYWVREPRQAQAPERWSGWSLIPLEQAAGTTSLVVRGRSGSGAAVQGSRRLTIEAKRFPEERLKVAPAYVEPPAEVSARLERERLKLASVYRNRRSSPPASGPFRRPVPGSPTSIFGLRRIYNGKPRSPHPGLDLRAAEGTKVAASGRGHVALAEDLYYSGLTVILDHGGGLFTIYAHLSKLLVKAEDDVAAGQTIGLSGATGRVTGPHLHWGAKIGDRPFDPTALLDPALF